eukprot:TRINITY_DN31722_c0_g1_i1.p1 TRINITY_DN31722_c0_g1~~TRINITY_DN31722_c0_g1_i1.p1  ORF type:complete len:493 (-),score=107.69 TRINITY_DN31722_c0_g1_i1:86-1564(-)
MFFQVLFATFCWCVAFDAAGAVHGCADHAPAAQRRRPLVRHQVLGRNPEEEGSAAPAALVNVAEPSAQHVAEKEEVRQRRVDQHAPMGGPFADIKCESLGDAFACPFASETMPNASDSSDALLVVSYGVTVKPEVAYGVEENFLLQAEVRRMNKTHPLATVKMAFQQSGFEFSSGEFIGFAEETWKVRGGSFGLTKTLTAPGLQTDGWHLVKIQRVDGFLVITLDGTVISDSLWWRGTPVAWVRLVPSYDMLEVRNFCFECYVLSPTGPSGQALRTESDNSTEAASRGTFEKDAAEEAGEGESKQATASIGGEAPAAPAPAADPGEPALPTKSIEGFVQAGDQGLVLGKGKDARLVVLISANVSTRSVWGSTTSARGRAMVKEAEPEPSSDAQRWLVYGVDGKYLRVVEVEVFVLDGLLRARAVSAKYRSGYEAFTGDLREELTGSYATMDRTKLATQAAGAGTGLLGIVYGMKASLPAVSGSNATANVSAT